MKVLISGLINIETTLKVDKFPIEYQPVLYPFYGIKSSVSGVGYNISKAMKILGDKISFMSIIGNDSEGENIIKEFKKEGVDTSNILKIIDETPQSIIIYDNSGRRQINVDLKSIQEIEYPEDKITEEIKTCDLAILANINFSRKYLKIAKGFGKKIATDVHVLSNLDDEYNKDFLEYSDILFLSNEDIINREEEFMKEIISKYEKDIIVIGMGDKGALLYTKGNSNFDRVEAKQIRPIINTIGAGDSLFSSFLHFYLKGETSLTALKKAAIFAGYKIGEKGAAEGFLSENKVNNLYNEVWGY